MREETFDSHETNTSNIFSIQFFTGRSKKERHTSQLLWVKQLTFLLFRAATKFQFQKSNKISISGQQQNFNFRAATKFQFQGRNMILISGQQQNFYLWAGTKFQFQGSNTPEIFTLEEFFVSDETVVWAMGSNKR